MRMLQNILQTPFILQILEVVFQGVNGTLVHWLDKWCGVGREVSNLYLRLRHTQVSWVGACIIQGQYYLTGYILFPHLW